MEENQTKLLFGVDLKGRRRRQIACVMSLAWLFERQTNGNIGWQCTVVKSQVSCALPSLKSGSKGAKKWMLVLVVQRWHTLLVDWQQGRHATKTSFLSVTSLMLSGVANAVLKSWAQQRWQNIGKVRKYVV